MSNPNPNPDPNPNPNPRPDADQGGVIWKLRRFPGDTEYFMSGEVEMMATMGGKPWSRPPITMDFQVARDSPDPRP
jgi:hypothetical protein